MTFGAGVASTTTSRSRRCGAGSLWGVASAMLGPSVTGGVGAGGVGAGGVGAGDVAGGVAVDTAVGGTPPDPHPNRKNPGMSKDVVATLAKMFIPIPVVSGVIAVHTGLKLRQLGGSQFIGPTTVQNPYSHSCLPTKAS